MPVLGAEEHRNVTARPNLCVTRTLACSNADHLSAMLLCPLPPPDSRRDAMPIPVGTAARGRKGTERSDTLLRYCCSSACCGRSVSWWANRRTRVAWVSGRPHLPTHATAVAVPGTVCRRRLLP